MIEVGDYVVFRPIGEPEPLRGRVLAATATEYAVSVGLSNGAQHIYWVLKREAVQV